MPLEIMEDPDWKCPHCLGICFAGACKREGKMQPYEPKGTLLGHDTKKVADVRSVEALVDFSVSNLNWIKDDEALPRAQSKRMSRAKADADKAKENGADIEDDADEADYIDESRVEYEYSPANATPLDPALGGNAKENEMDDSDAYFARRLQQANVSVPSPAAMLAGAPVSSVPALEGYAAVSTAGYMPPPAHMYGHIDENGHTNYPDPYRPGSVEPMNQGEDASASEFNKRKRASDEDEHEDIAMSKGKKAKKPRLSAAGFRSVDLADAGPAPPKNEMQRQFSKEKERKALEKAKAEGRFITMQAALKGKKRIVKFSVPGDRLGQILAAKATQAAELAQAALAAVGGSVAGAGPAVGSNAPSSQHRTAAATAQPNGNGPTMDLLTSDIAPKKDPKEVSRELYQQRKDEGYLVTSKTKKALIPVEKDDNYGYRSMEKKLKIPNTAAAKRPGRKSAANHVEYEEVDIGSDLDEEEEPERNNNNANKRRDIPTYLKDRHNGEEDLPDYLPDDFRDRQWDHKRTGARKPNATASESNGLEPSPGQAASRPLAGKRPSMRPAAASSPDQEDDDADADANSAESGDEDAVAASTQSSGHATPVGAAMAQPPSWTTTNKPQSSNTPSATVSAAQKQKQKAQRQSAMEEENRKAKLQALQMLDDASPGASVSASSSKGKNVRFSMGDKADVNNISMADGLEDESSDDEVDSVPAKVGPPSKMR
jgi:hypothetical protein